jgi:hypothetical protein
MADEASRRGSVERVVALFSRAVRDPDAPLRIEADAPSFLREVLGDDAQAMGAEEARRLLVYRTLVRRGITSGARAQLPNTAARLGAAFEAWVERWLDEELPRSPYMRDVARELVEWAAPRWRQDATIPPWMADFARHEAALFEVRAAPSNAATGLPLTLDRPVLFDGAVQLVRYAWDVHEALEGASLEEPAAKPTELLLYRDAEHEARALALTPLAAAILERLLAGEALGRAITSACAALGFVVSDEALRGTAEMLADLAAKGALLGASGAGVST